MGVAGYSQIIENHARRKAELPRFLSYIAYTLAFEDTDGESPQACHVFITLGSNLCLTLVS
jgi:hypothetical protein